MSQENIYRNFDFENHPAEIQNNEIKKIQLAKQVEDKILK